jgi:putative hydrolase of the HAD superfamily
MSRPVTTVIFDYGGVLSLPLDPESLRTLAARCGLPVERFAVEHLRERLAYDRADIGLEAYWSRILAVAGRTADPGLLEGLNREDLRVWSRINDRVLGWSRKLRTAGVRTAILSNMPQPLLDLMNADPSFAWLREFEVRVFSCEVRMVKPELGIFRLLLERMGELAASCVFLDDFERNVAGGIAAGLRAVHFTSTDQASAALVDLGLPTL